MPFGCLFNRFAAILHKQYSRFLPFPRSQAEEAKGAGIGLWSIRFRFRVSKPLSISKKEISISLDGRAGTLVAGNGDLVDSEWIILCFDGLETERDAMHFAMQLKRALILTAARECLVLT